MATSRVKPSMGCGYVAAVVLLLAGAGLMGLAATRYETDGGVTARVAIPATIGLGLVVGAAWYTRFAKRVVDEFAADEKRRGEFPNQPWKWRKEWLAPSLKSNDAAGVGLAWFIAVVVNAMSFPVAYAIFTENDVPPPVYLALIFPVIGAGLLGSAVYKTTQWRKYGRSRFIPSTMPGAIGGYLGGVIEVPARVALVQDARLTLRCMRRETTRGDRGGNHATETVLWEHEERISPERWMSDVAHTQIPVLFHIPAGLSPTDLDDRDRQVIWRLVAQGAVKGVDFATAFDVPVFVTGENALRPAPGGPLLPVYRDTAPDTAELNQAGIARQPDGWRFSSRHLWIPRTISLVIALGLAGLLIGFIGREVHWLAWTTTTLFFAFAWLMSADLWSGPFELEFRGGTIVVRQRRLRGARERQVARVEVAEIRAEKSLGLGLKQYYRLVLVGREVEDPTKAAAGEPFRARKLRHQLARLGRELGVEQPELMGPRGAQLLAQLAAAPRFEIVFARHVPGPRLVESVKAMVLAQIRATQRGK